MVVDFSSTFTIDLSYTQFDGKRVILYITTISNCRRWFSSIIMFKLKKEFRLYKFYTIILAMNPELKT